MKTSITIPAVIALSFSLFSCKDNGTTTVYVDSPVLRVPSQYPTIQQAIDASKPFDSIIVSSGTYVENINFRGKAIIVRSINGFSSTTIDGDSMGSTVTFKSGEPATATLDGFTIINGSKSGVLCDSNSSPTLINLRITSNLGSYGGGIGCLTRSSPTITNVTLIGNSGFYGGGIYCWNNSNPHLRNVRITGNIAIDGGGITCSESSNPLLENVLIVKNSAAYGGGVEVLFSANPTFHNVTIAQNSSSLSLGGIYCNSDLNLSLVNSIVWGNAGAEVYFEPINTPNSISVYYSNVEGGRSGIIDNNHGTVNWLSGNINADPLFRDTSAGDFRLQNDSPCINRGDPTPIYNDPDGSTNDMGAYGGPFGNWF